MLIFSSYLQRPMIQPNPKFQFRTEYEKFITEPKIFTKKIRAEIISIEFSIEMS